MLNTLIIDVSEFNKEDDINAFTNATCYKIICSFEQFSGNVDEVFMITDSRNNADKAKEKGIGFAVYLNSNSSEESFTDALYCVERISDTSDEVIHRMFLRYKGLPWAIFETDRCIVREITLDDIDDLYVLYSDSETKQYIEDLYAEKVQEITFTKEYIANQYRFFEYGIWVVIDKATEQLIGRAGLSDRAGFSSVELGFIFRKDYWGKGYAYEVCSEILRYAKKTLAFDRIISFTMDENKRAIDLLDRLDFEYVGMEHIDLGEFRMYSIDL